MNGSIKTPSKPKKETTQELMDTRHKLGMSQKRFSETYGISIGRLKDWEQGRTNIDLPSAIYIQMIANYPNLIQRLAAGKKTD